MTIAPHPLGTLGVIVVAAGRGVRLNAGKPKAFVELAGHTLLEHAARTVLSLPGSGQLVLVVPEALAAEALEIAEVASTKDSAWDVSVVGGGRERHESVRKGLDALRESITTVLVHDAARPLTPAEVFTRVISSVREHGDAAIPAIPLADTIKRADGQAKVVETVDRSSLVAVQTPQGFPRDLLVAAHESAQARSASEKHGAPTDDAEVVQRFGGTVRIVPGSIHAHKLTQPSDMLVLEGLLRGTE